MRDLGSRVLIDVWVRAPPPAPQKSIFSWGDCMLWEKRGGVAYSNVEEAILSTSRQTVGELLHPPTYQPGSIAGVAKAGLVIFKARSEGRHVYIVGDYDADGITATAILSRLFN